MFEFDFTPFGLMISEDISIVLMGLGIAMLVYFLKKKFREEHQTPVYPA